MAILDLMRNKAIDRQERYDTYAVKQLPDKSDINAIHIPGSLSILDLKKRRRYLLEEALVHLGDGVRESPTTAARDYLVLDEFKAARLRGETVKTVLWAHMEQSPAFPYYVKPMTCDEGYYIDIQRCFFALMHIAGWEVAYSPSKYLLKGRTPSDFPLSENGISRNSLVSCAANRQLYALIPPDWKTISLGHYNPLLNTSLNVFIRDTLQCIASRAIELGAAYCQVDGYIAPNLKTARAIGAMIEDYGLQFKVKGRGFTIVRGPGAYRVGRHKSLLLDQHKINTPAVGIRDIPERAWIERHMSSLAAMDGALHLVSDKL